ncbi:hypothetical protein J3R82DRAFT_53 [Butyriboletus roseoflavus]|nr:hypothetical protein J3R82DRAFT_53 [Butyriboletus roseoflavus]
MVGPEEVGREDWRNNAGVRRTFWVRGDSGCEADESTLFGGGYSFRDELSILFLTKLLLLTSTIA